MAFNTDELVPDHPLFFPDDAPPEVLNAEEMRDLDGWEIQFFRIFIMNYDIEDFAASLRVTRYQIKEWEGDDEGKKVPGWLTYALLGMRYHPEIAEERRVSFAEPRKRNPRYKAADEPPKAVRARR